MGPSIGQETKFGIAWHRDGKGMATAVIGHVEMCV